MISFYGALNKFYAYHKSGDMKAPKCKTCGEEHWGLCHNHDAKGAIADQRPKKSTAARKDAPSAGLPVSRAKTQLADPRAGTQAPPVDTTRFEMIASMLPFAKTLDVDLILEAQKRLKRPGRPKTITDMKAYKADKARERRQKLKEKSNV